MTKTQRVQILVGALVCVVAFLGACVLIRRLLPFPEVPDVRAKREHFLTHPNDYDTLFVGSSRINHQIIPAQFDQHTRAAGVATKTFNAGVAGMRPPEDNYFFDQLVAARPRRLRWVFFELNMIGPRMDDDLRGSMRAQYWHDWPRLRLVWRRVTDLKPTKKRRSAARVWQDWSDSLAEFPEHLGLFIREMSNLGKGEFLARQLIAHPEDWRRTLPNHLGPDLAGWRPTGRGEEMTPANRAQVEKERADRLAQPAIRDTTDAASQDCLEEMLVKTERLGAIPVLVLPPRYGKRVVYPRPERTAKTILLDFDDPARFPELCENRYRLDGDHLNTAGAELFTRLVAEHWIAAAKARGLIR